MLTVGGREKGIEPRRRGRGDDAALDQTAVARRCGDRRGCGVRIENDERRFVAGSHAVMIQPQHRGGVGRRHVERDAEVGVGEEARSIADHHRAAEHVGIAVRPPGVADIVVAREHADARGAQQRDRRKGTIAGRIGHDRDARRRQDVGGARRLVPIDVAQRIGVADRDLALHTGGGGAGSDAAELVDALPSRFVQVNVDPDAVPCGDTEHHVEVRIGIAVERRRIEAADKAGAVADGGVEQVGGARRGEDTRLWKRDDLDIDPPPPWLARGQHGMEMGEAERAVDIDMAAHRHRAEAMRLRQQRIGPFRNRQGVGDKLFFDRQPLPKPLGGTMRAPAVADEALVEMDMPLDEAGKDQQPAKVDDFGIVTQRVARDEPTAADRQIADQAIPAQGIAEQGIAEQPGRGSGIGHVRHPRVRERRRWPFAAAFANGMFKWIAFTNGMVHMFDLRLLRTFVAVADSASFTLAAKRLHSTQSTVSQHLGRLEAAVGRSLIDRSARPIAATPSGERLLGYARRLLALQDEAQALLADASGTRTIRIGVPDDIVTSAMSGRFAQFAARHRDIRLDVTTGLSRDLKARFRAGEFDIAIVKEAVADGDARATFPEPLGWFEAQGSAPWQDPIPLVTFPPGGLYRDVMIDRIERERRRWYIAFTGNSLGSVLSAVEAGLGVSVLPVSTTVAHAVEVSRLFPPETALTLSLYAWEAGGPAGGLLDDMVGVLAVRPGVATDPR